MDIQGHGLPRDVVQNPGTSLAGNYSYPMGYPGPVPLPGYPNTNLPAHSFASPHPSASTTYNTMQATPPQATTIQLFNYTGL